MRTLAGEKVNEKNMITNYDAHGFMVAAEELPKACTACPFWLVEAEKFEEGECFLTGHIIKTDGSHDEKRMDDCPIIQRKRRATVIEDYAFTITTRQDRTPAQVIDCGKGRYRYLTELECWRLQGYTDEDFERAKKAQQKKGRYYTALYKQAGNSIAVPIFESIFRKIILNEVREKEEQR